MERFQIPAENLLIELTETHFDEMPEHLQRFIRQCKQIGIRFALDDLEVPTPGCSFFCSIRLT